MSTRIARMGMAAVIAAAFMVAAPESEAHTKSNTWEHYVGGCIINGQLYYNTHAVGDTWQPVWADRCNGVKVVIFYYACGQLMTTQYTNAPCEFCITGGQSAYPMQSFWQTQHWGRTKASSTWFAKSLTH